MKCQQIIQKKYLSLELVGVAIVGAIDEEEAIEYFEGDIGNYIEDSDTT